MVQEIKGSVWEISMRLTDKVAVVTGAGQWIGRAIALRLSDEGAHIIVNDVVPERANEVAEEIRISGHKALAVGIDVTNRQLVDEMVKHTLGEFGKIDILVNNVGGSGGGSPGGKLPFFYDMKDEIWDYVISLNLKSTYNCSRAVIDHMIKRKTGKIINISSQAGIRGMVGLVHYSTAKAGIIGFTMALSQEVAPYGIRVNCVCPGPTGRDIDQPQLFKNEQQQGGLGRDGKPDEVAALVAFLASDEADYISGQNYIMGGRS